MRSMKSIKSNLKFILGKFPYAVGVIVATGIVLALLGYAIASIIGQV